MKNNVDFHYHGPVIAFDLDDTLFLERDYCRSGFRYLEGLIETITGSKPEGLYAGMNRALEERANHFDFLEKWLKTSKVSLPDELSVKDLVASYRSHLPASLPPAPGAIKMLDNFMAKGYRLALITDGRSDTQRKKIQALGIAKYFHPDDIYISEERGVDKHSREAFVNLVNRYPEAKRFYYIGDNPEKDFYHPNLLGWTTIGLVYNPESTQLEGKYLDLTSLHKPMHEIRGLDEVESFIELSTSNI